MEHHCLVWLGLVLLVNYASLENPECNAEGALCDSDNRRLGICIKKDDKIVWTEYANCGNQYCDADGFTCTDKKLKGNSETSERMVNYASLATPTCEKEGNMCDNDCRKLGLCITTGEEIEWIEDTDCTPEYCDADSFGCTPKLPDSCLAETETIKCGNATIFPHMKDCKKYYECITVNGNPVLQTQNCTTNHSYDSCTGECDVRLFEEECPNTEPWCKSYPYLGAIKDNERLYYLCVEINHVKTVIINKCKDGYFNENTNHCEVSKIPGCKSDNVKCVTYGKIPDPGNCEMYYNCNSKLEISHESCYSGYYFDVRTSSCTRGSC